MTDIEKSVEEDIAEGTKARLDDGTPMIPYPPDQVPAHAITVIGPNGPITVEIDVDSDEEDFADLDDREAASD